MKASTVKGNSRERLFLSVAGAVVLAGLVLLMVLHSGRADLQESDPDPNADSSTLTRSAAPAAVPDGLAQERTASSFFPTGDNRDVLRFRVLSASHMPVASASVIAVTERSRLESSTNAWSPLGKTNRQGFFDTSRDNAKLEHAECFICSADGMFSAFVREAEQDHYLAVIPEHLTTHVTLVDSKGEPVKGAHLFVSRAPLGSRMAARVSDGSLNTKALPGVWRQKSATYQAVSDADGVATLKLPAGDYSWDVHATGFLPNADELGAIQAGESRVLHLQEISIAALRLEGGVALAHYAEFPRGAFDQRLWGHMDAQRQGLASTLGDCVFSLILLGDEGLPKSLDAEVYVRETGWRTVPVPVTRLSNSYKPHTLRLEPHGAARPLSGRVRVAIVNESGVAMEPVEWMLKTANSSRTRRHEYLGQEDGDVEVPPESYYLKLKDWCLRAAEPPKPIRVDANGTHEVTVTVRGEFQRCKVVLWDEQLDAPADIAGCIVTLKQGKDVVGHWNGSDAQVDMWLPRGRHEVEALVSGHKVMTQWVDVYSNATVKIVVRM